MAHQAKTIRAEWAYAICDSFVVKQLPTLVTWGLSLLYARQVSPTAAYQLDVAQGGDLGHNLRYVASAVSHVFLASGEVLDLVKRLNKLSGYTQRVTELEDVLVAAGDLRATSGGEVGDKKMQMSGRSTTQLMYGCIRRCCRRMTFRWKKSASLRQMAIAWCTNWI